VTTMAQIESVRDALRRKGVELEIPESQELADELVKAIEKEGVLGTGEAWLVMVEAAAQGYVDGQRAHDEEQMESWKCECGSQIMSAKTKDWETPCCVKCAEVNLVCPTCEGAIPGRCCGGLEHRCLVIPRSAQGINVDPFSAEIYENYTLHLMCKGCQHESAMDI